jgi:RNA polymerase sigma-70 factor (ECF subfamily)
VRAISLPLPGASIETALTFDAVYERHFDFVYRVIVRLAGRSHAEDLAQEVFAVVHRRLDEFEGRAKLTTWLFQIAYRVVGAHVRRERMRGLIAAALPLELATREQGHDPYDRVEQSIALARAVRKLSWKKRAVLVLHEVEGWPCELIAERMDVPVATVWTRLHHARKELAELVAREDRAGGAR